MENIKLTPKRKEIIESMQFDSILSVLHYYPYRYDIYKEEKLGFTQHDKKVTFEGTISSDVKVDYLNKNRLKTTFTLLNNKNDTVKCVMFNRFGWSKVLKVGTHLVVNGKFNAFNNEISISNFFIGSLNGGVKITPIYSLPADVKDSTYRTMVSYLYDEAIKRNLLVEQIPEHYIKKYRLISYKEAVKYIHNPENEEQLRQANRYLKYEEFLSFCCIGALKRRLFAISSGIKHKEIAFSYVNKFIESLPFQLTNDQQTALNEILKDLKSISTMSRLLQGDVGSGKTIVAIIALIANYTASYQGALMVPTDILARQHYQSLISLIDNNKIKVALLVSDMPSSEKKEIVEKISKGEVDIVIGTHALIQDTINFKNLGLAIVDEQHRFGVKQRLMLKEKGKNVDVLYMSATPIPRTLASTIYMDMDVSTIEAYPYKERIIHTKYIASNSINGIKKEIDDYLNQNKKIYIVCPAIEESKLDISNVTETYDKISRQFKNYKVGLLHGKMTSSEKEDIMNQFQNNDIQILVSTTVIEVGINIIDANMMIIYNAERFGLAQIHQLRGRIARDGQVGYCYLLSSNLDDDVANRLEFIASTNNGFKISEYDLQRRGSGDMLGLAQSGKSPFMIANLIDDFNILQAASKDASEIMAHQNDFEEYLNRIRTIIHTSEKYVD